MTTARTPHRSWPLLAGATLLAFAAQAAQGQSPQDQAPQDPAAGMDADGDGRISAQEHAAAATAMFTRMDADRDGQLTPAEMANHRAMMRVAPRGAGDAMHKGAGMTMPGMHAPGMGMQMQMQMHDGDGDGVITAAEHAAAAKATFDRIDTNHDGRIIAAEWTASHPMMGAGAPGMGAGMGASGARGMPMAGHARLAAMDSDGNGSVSADEHARHAATMFESMDADRNGYLAGDEIARHRALMMGSQGSPSRNDPAGAPAQGD